MTNMRYVRIVKRGAAAWLLVKWQHLFQPVFFVVGLICSPVHDGLSPRTQRVTLEKNYCCRYLFCAPLSSLLFYKLGCPKKNQSWFSERPQTIFSCFLVVFNESITKVASQVSLYLWTGESKIQLWFYLGQPTVHHFNKLFLDSIQFHFLARHW